MCHLNPILNGESNLCKVKATLNTKKKIYPSAQDVTDYMKKMTDNMQVVLVEVGNISNKCTSKCQQSAIKKFVTLLKEQLNRLYELTLFHMDIAATN